MSCARWNLTPLEQRWEAIEQCERAYRDTKQRVSTDNIAPAWDRVHAIHQAEDDYRCQPKLRRLPMASLRSSPFVMGSPQVIATNLAV